jgi:hypothetical protein
MKLLAEFLIILGWLAGIVLSKGKLVLVAIFFPPYAWYLVVERLMHMSGMI